MSLCYISLNLSYPTLDHRSQKELALIVKPWLKASPNSPIVSYRYYYQDLPVYLERPIGVVHYKGELRFGAEHQNAPWIMDEETFWKRWQNDPRMFMIMRAPEYKAILRRSKLCPDYIQPKLYLLAETTYSVLLTNQSP